MNFIIQRIMYVVDWNRGCVFLWWQVIGRGQRVQSQDRSRTPYTAATIKEIQRLYSPGTNILYSFLKKFGPTAYNLHTPVINLTVAILFL